MQLKDTRQFLGGLNKDDAPHTLPEGDYSDMLNMRTGSSSEQKSAGNAETLQGEIEILLDVAAEITYYGEAIGGEFVYAGFEEVQIGTQVWMKNNWDYNYPGSKVYNNNEANRAIYGGLYTHNQVMASDFVPAGWDVPTEADIDELLTELGGELLAGGKMKNVGTGLWTTPNTGADDSSGFKAVPGGKFDAIFSLLGLNGLLWLQDDGEPVAPVALNGSEITGITFVANWKAADGATGYYLDVATDALFTAMVAGFDDLDVGNVLLYLVNGLSGNTDYYFRVRAYNEVGTSNNSNTSSLTTLIIYDDWFLPSKDELEAMYDNLHLFGVGGFNPTGLYWSSTESFIATAYEQDFNDGIQYSVTKNSNNYVRACRSFTDLVGAYSLRDVGPAGGWIFYIDGAGTGYLEAAPSDQSASYAWSNIAGVAIGTTGTAIGTGQANTTAIIGQVGHIDSAAKLCDDLEIE